jgi:site-specific recombinase XerD
MIPHLNILFFPFKSKINNKGLTPIFCRITFNRTRKQFAIGINIPASIWNNKSQRCRGNSEDIKRINKSLINIEQKLNKAYADLANEKETFYLNDIFNRYSGSDKEYKSILQAFEYHNHKMHSLIGKDYVQATYDKFVVIQNHTKNFIKDYYKKPDYPLTELKLNFLNDFDFYLKTEKGLNQNTINKIIERVKKVIKIAVGNGWLAADPFLLYQKKKYLKQVVFLTNAELNKLENHHFAQERLAVIRDCFIFSCYTGLAYNEAAELKSEHLSIAEGDFIWIDIIRKKTQRPLTIPILPKALDVLKKYGYPDNKGHLLPLVSNQKFNSYLHEIEDIVGITKHLTHHVARKTFASTVLMNNDIPIEIVSFLLGHSKTTTTELHYAKVVKESVVRHIQGLNKKL